MRWANDRKKWTKRSSSDALRNVCDADTFLAGIEAYRYTGGSDLVSIGIPILTEVRERYLESHWQSSISHWGVKPDIRFFKLCTNWVNSNPVNPSSVYLQTWKIDPGATYHECLMGRVRECMTYGCFKPPQWISFMCAIGLQDTAEIRSIAGLVIKSNGIPYKIKRGDNSVIEDVALFYNIPNLVEALLNVASLRASLNKRILTMYTSTIDNDIDVYAKNTINLDALLDELVFTYCVCPKVICKEMRGFLTMVIRTCGALAVRQRTFTHDTMNMMPDNRSSELKYEDFDARERLLPFFQTRTMTEEYRNGLEYLTRRGMHKMRHAVEIYMCTSLVKTSPDDFIAFGSFLHSIMALAGYGRALPSSSAPKQGDERSEDPHGIADSIEEKFMDFGRQADENGFVAPEGDRWIPVSMSYWKSTSAGVRPEEISIVMSGKPIKVKIRKKAAIGALLGRKGFSRAKLRQKTSNKAPGSVGYRDVPYKPTRLIYVVPISTQYAQIAVASNIVNYVSSRGVNSARARTRLDPSHCITGSGSTCGIRIYDNYDTIAASGDAGVISIGTDLSSYDSNLRFWNFRKPMLSALKRLNANKVFGPERIPGPEMVDYAFGEGRVYKSYWDNGRAPAYIVRETASSSFSSIYSKYVSQVTVGERLPSLKSLPGVKFVAPGNYMSFDLESALHDSVPIPWEHLRVVVYGDGSDLTLLTSEASGELTTLAANTIVNLAMQEKAVSWLEKHEMAKYIEIKYMKGVGDDAEWICTLSGTPTPEEIDSMLDGLKQLYAEMGHTFSPSKTYVMPHSSEFVQTFARFGLYIPRDQIMLIASEKPRSIRDPAAFVNSFRQILLAKVARGFNIDYADTLFLWHARELTKVTLRRHAIKTPSTGPSTLRLINNGETEPSIHVKRQDYIRASESYYEKSIPIIHVYSSVSRFMLPSTAGGHGWNPLMINVTNTPAMFMVFIGAYSTDFAKNMYRIMCFFSRLPTDEGVGDIDEGALGRITLPHELRAITTGDIFSPRVQRNLYALRGIDIGRSNGERVPQRILRQGLELETFMQNESNFAREAYAEKFLRSLLLPMRRLKHDGDEWVLAFKYEFSAYPKDSLKHLSFYRGLHPDLNAQMEIFGMSWKSAKMGRTMEQLRLVISRDPALRTISSPEEVLHLLEKYGVSTAADTDVGYAVLAKAGFEPDVISSILEIMLNPDIDLAPDATYGAFSDDFSAVLNLYTTDRLSKFSFPALLTSGEKRIILLHASNRSIFETMYRDEPILIDGCTGGGNNDDHPLKDRLILLPRFSRRIALGQRERARLLPSILKDLMDIKE